jgi:hypothetical protein
MKYTHSSPSEIEWKIWLQHIVTSFFKKKGDILMLFKTVNPSNKYKDDSIMEKIDRAIRKM